MSSTVKSVWVSCALTLVALSLHASEARAYDLSRSYTPDDETEHGFVHVSGALWMPALGSFSRFHQLSLDYGLEGGFRIASLRGHNIYVVFGASYSPQYLDPDEVGRIDSKTALIVGYGGVRYIPGALCFASGTGCPFLELRLGLTFESAERSYAGHGEPSAEITLLPGLGYRFRFGPVQVGGRVDVSYTGDSYEHTFGWVTVAGFVGIGW